MKLTRKNIKLLVRKNIISLLHEASYLSDITRKLIGAYGDDIISYDYWINNLEPKYHKQLTAYLKQDNKTNDEINYGEIIFLLLAHQHYAKTKIPAEYRDFNKISLEEMRTLILSVVGAHRLPSLKRVYEKLVETDKAIIRARLEEEIEEKKREAEAKGEKYVETTQVAPDLYLLTTIGGWQILQPTSKKGSKNFGAYGWCTVFGDYFDVYTEMKLKLYYLAKDGKDYKKPENIGPEQPYGYGYDWKSKPYDYLCIGFDADGTINLRGEGGGTSVWGNQDGVTKQSLDNQMGITVSNKILSFLNAHYKKTGVNPKNISGTLGIDEREAQLREREKAANIELRARVPEVLKSEIHGGSGKDEDLTKYQGEKDRGPAPDLGYQILINTLMHPSLSESNAVAIYDRYVAKTNGKMALTSAYKEMGDERFKADLAIRLCKAHTILDARTGAGCINAIKKVENGKLLKSLITDGSALTWNIWYNPDVSPDICEYIESHIDPEKIFDVEGNFIGEPGKGIASESEYSFLLYIIKLYLVMMQLSNAAGETLDDAIDLGKYDIGLYAWSKFTFTNMGTSKDNIHDNFMNLIAMASKSPKAGERLRSKINLSRMSYYENLSFDEIKQSSIMFQALYMDRTYRPENIQHIYKKTGIKLSKEMQNKAKIASKAEKILEDFCQNQNLMMSKKDLEDSESLRVKLKKYLFFIHDFGGEFYSILGHDGRARLNRRVINCAPYVLRDDEFVRFLNNFKTFDPYYVINKLYIECKKHNDVEKAIAVYDFGEQLMAKYTAENTLIFNRPGQDVIKESISKLIYFDGTNVSFDKNVDMFLNVLKSHESIFFKMLNYLFKRNDANLSNDIWEYSKGMVRMFQYAIDHKKISFLEASNWAYKKINPIADASGKWTIRNRFVGYLKDTHEEQQNAQINEAIATSSKPQETTAAAMIAKKEAEWWNGPVKLKKGGQRRRHEKDYFTNPDVKQRIEKYYKAAKGSIYNSTEKPWSGAFLSYALDGDPDFAGTKLHKDYMKGAALNRFLWDEGNSGDDLQSMGRKGSSKNRPDKFYKGYVAFRPEEYSPDIGDLVCNPRGKSGYINFDPTKKRFKAGSGNHCDICIDPGCKNIAGGNVGGKVCKMLKAQPGCTAAIKPRGKYKMSITKNPNRAKKKINENKKINISRHQLRKLIQKLI